MADILKQYADPGYWVETIKTDLGAQCRVDWLKQCERADELKNNSISISSTYGADWLPRATYLRIRNYVMGKLAYGRMEPKVLGTEDVDDEIGTMYEHSIKFEFNRPRGLRRKIGRDQVPRFMGDCIDYGLGSFNTRFDPHIRDKENFTGSIINEAVSCKGIVLDSSVEHLDEIGHISRVFDLSEGQVRAMFPNYKGDIPTTKEDPLCHLVELQFRVSKPMKMRMSTGDIVGLTGDSRPYWNKGDIGVFKEKYAGKNDGGTASTEVMNAEAERLWESMKYDDAAVPMAYNLVFLVDKAWNIESAETVAPIKYIGTDFTFTLLPFLHMPGTPYPYGVAHLVYEDQKAETILFTLYVMQSMLLNNSGGAIDANMIVGRDDQEKMKTAENVRNQLGFWFLKRGQGNAFEQRKVDAPNNAQITALQLTRDNANDWMNTHKGVAEGRQEFSDTPFKAIEQQQAGGGFPLVPVVSGLRIALATIFAKTGWYIHKFLPENKRIAISNVDDKREYMQINKEKIQKYNPFDFDITCDLDIDSPADKAQKRQFALMMFQMGMYGKEKTLKECGERNIAKTLGELQDYQTGQTLVAIMKNDPELAQAINQAIQTKQLEEQAKNA